MGQRGERQVSEVQGGEGGGTREDQRQDGEGFVGSGRAIAQVSSLSKELAEIDAAATEATKIRNAEKASFIPAEKDLSESAEACGAAIQVLREYYEGAALVQTGAT